MALPRSGQKNRQWYYRINDSGGILVDLLHLPGSIADPVCLASGQKPGFHPRTGLFVFLEAFIMYRISAVMILLFGMMTVGVQAETAPVPDPPDLPPTVQSGTPLEPDVTIVRRGQEVVEEYRIRGRLYMIKVKPKAGPSYYMLDSDGDGNMDVRRSDLEKDLQIPQWVLFSW